MYEVMFSDVAVQQSYTERMRTKYSQTCVKQTPMGKQKVVV